MHLSSSFPPSHTKKILWIIIFSIILFQVYPFSSFDQSSKKIHAHHHHHHNNHILFSSNNGNDSPYFHKKKDTKHEQQKIHHQQDRKKFLSSSSSKILSSFIVSSNTLLISPKEINASFLSKKERIQLEICLITIKRLQYWAMNVVTKLKDIEITTEQKKKNIYLEARLGSKALLSKKLGGGGNNLMVITLSSFQLRECLQDATYYIGSNAELKNKRKELEDTSTTIIESLASIVEFDGLDNTIDPSPRSSLLERMYSVEKVNFVCKILELQLIPNCKQFLYAFRTFDDGKVMKRVDDYIFSYYPSEIPISILYSIM